MAKHSWRDTPNFRPQRQFIAPQTLSNIFSGALKDEPF